MTLMRPETTLVVPELLLLLELESELLVSVFEFVSAVGVDFLVVDGAAEVEVEWCVEE